MLKKNFNYDLKSESFRFLTLSKDMHEKDHFVWNTHVVAADANMAAAAFLVNTRGVFEHSIIPSQVIGQVRLAKEKLFLLQSASHYFKLFNDGVTHSRMVVG